MTGFKVSESERSDEEGSVSDVNLQLYQLVSGRRKNTKLTNILSQDAATKPTMMPTFKNGNESSDALDGNNHRTHGGEGYLQWEL